MMKTTLFYTSVKVYFQQVKNIKTSFSNQSGVFEILRGSTIDFDDASRNDW